MDRSLDLASYASEQQSTGEFEDECLLCKKQISEKEFPQIIAKALQRKYCLNLNNYFYLKDINRLLARERYSLLTRSRARIHLHEWQIGAFPQDMFKRMYSKSEFDIKLKRLWKFYGRAITKPKMVLKEYETALRRYYRYQAKKRLQQSYLFGKDDPVVRLPSAGTVQLLRPVQLQVERRSSSREVPALLRPRRAQENYQRRAGQKQTSRV